MNSLNKLTTQFIIYQNAYALMNKVLLNICITLNNAKIKTRMR